MFTVVGRNFGLVEKTRSNLTSPAWEEALYDSYTVRRIDGIR